MLSLTRFNICFRPCWRMSLLAFIALLLLTRLGFWQLQRAHEKKQMLTAHQGYVKQAPIMWESNFPLPSQYQRIKVNGHFMETVLFLDNQHYQHQFGYHVISPFIMANDTILLIDRGWVAADLTRQTLPVTKTPTGPLYISGSAYYPSEKSWLLGQALEIKQTNLAIVERIDFKLIRQFLHKSVYPFIIRLDKHEPNGYVREWPVVAMPPERHYAYALQWFAMALVIFILFIVLNIKRKHE